MITSTALARDYGENGTTVSSFAEIESEVASTIDTQGRSLVLGTVRNDSNSFFNDFVVARYSSSGQLDTSFGMNGRAVIDFGGNNQARGLAVDHQGRIVVVGFGTGGNTLAGVIIAARLLTDGRLDPAFGTAGKTVLETGYNAVWAATAVAIQADDRILVSGFVREIFDTSLWNYVSSRFLIMRLTTSGALDRTFGEQPAGRTAEQRNGLRRVGLRGEPRAFRNVYNYGYGLVVDPRDGSIIQVGEADNERPAILRYSSDGALLAFVQNDEAFDGRGDGWAEDVVLTAEGDVVVSGRAGGSFVEFLSETLERTSLRLYRDIEQDLGGTVAINSLAAQEDGSVVAAGVLSNGTESRVLLSRFNANHEFDELFGEHGTIVASMAPFTPIQRGGQFGTASGGGVGVQDSGRIVVTGTAQSSTERDIFLAAFAERQSRREFHAQLEWFSKDLVYRPAWALGDEVMFGYSVDAIWDDPASGLYAFGLTSTNEPPVLVLRGTEAPNDVFDILDDLNPEGIGFGQFESAVTLPGASRPDSETEAIVPVTMADWLLSVTLQTAPVITGHSLGGALAQWLAAYYTGTLNRTLEEVVTFNAPGIRSESADSFVPSLVGTGVTHYVVQGDIVSMGGQRFLFGQVRFASFVAGSLLAFNILGDKHLKPILADGIGDQFVPSGLTLAEPQSTSWLNASYFLYNDLDYLLVISELSAALAAVSGNPNVARLPLNGFFRATAENTRRQFGEQLRPVIDGLRVAAATPGMQVSLPEFRFQIPGLIQIDTTGLSLRYLGGSNNTIRFVGRSEIDVNGLPTSVADFSGNRFLEVTRSGISGIAELAVNDVVIVPNELTIDAAALLIDTIDRRLAGSATVTIPPGIPVSGMLEFSGDRLSSIGLSVSNLNVPIPVPEPPVFFVNQLVASVADLDHPEPFPEIAGTIGVSVGPRVRIALPSWLGGGTTIELASLEGMAAIEPDQLMGQLGVNLLNGWITSAEGTFSQTVWNWDQQLIQIEGQLQVLGPLGFSATGLIQTTVDGRLSVDSEGSVSFTLPHRPGTPFRGQQIPVGILTGQYRNNLNLRDDFVLVQSSVAIGSKVVVRVGAKVFLDGSIQFSGLRLLGIANDPVILDADRFFAPAAAGSSISAENDNGEIDIPFVVDSDVETLLLVVDWEHAADGIALDVIDPNGVVYDEAAIGANSQIEILSDFSTSTSRGVAVAQAEAGTWRIRLRSIEPLGEITSNAYGTDQPSNLRIDRLDVDGSQLTVDYHAVDTDSTASISFYLDADASGTDGVFIGEAIEHDGPGMFSWSNASVPGGEYYVYAVIDSPSGLPTVAYSTSTVLITSPLLAVSVTANSSDSLSIEVEDSFVWLLRNGQLDPTFQPVDARLIQSLTMTGESGANRLDVSAVNAEAFPVLRGITLNGGAGNDTLIGSLSADMLLGAEGDDVLTGSSGDDILMGGTGTDMLLETADLNFTVTTDSMLMSQTGEPTRTDMLSGIELLNLTGGTSRNRIDASGFATSSGLRHFFVGGGGADTIIGTNGHDSITTFSSGADSIDGLDGNDTIISGNGQDAVNGGGGNDCILGQNGDDSLMGGAGDDSLFGNTEHDLLNGEGGLDLLFGSSGDDLLAGGPENDSLFGDAGHDSLFGEAGNDLLRGSIGTDTFDGGTGVADRVDEIGDSNFTVNGLQLSSPLIGTETAFNVERIDLAGGPSANYIDASLSSVAVILNGFGGNDTLVGGFGDDRLFGGDDDDLMTGAGGNDASDGGDGVDVLSGGDGNDSLGGQSGNDQLTGGPGSDVLHGGDGVDMLREASDTDMVLTNTLFVHSAAGMEGMDVLTSIELANLSGGTSRNRIDASAFVTGMGPIHTLIGGGGNDTIIGTQGRDRITTFSSGSDVINALGGNDTIFTGNGNDTVNGGAGNDCILGQNGNDSILGGTGDDFLFGNTENDTLNGEAGQDRLFGSAGDDLINGGTENDSLFGDAGNDTLRGDAGNDLLRGSIGTDVFDGGAGSSDRVDEAGDTHFTLIGMQLSSPLFGTETVINIERFDLSGGPSANRIDASQATVMVILNGLGGNDTLGGGSGNDLIFGGDGDDTLNGGTGNDRLEGGEGNDGLSGYVGNDSLFGQNGSDSLFGHDGADSLSGGDQDDTVVGGGGTSISGDQPDTLDGGNGTDTRDNATGDTITAIEAQMAFASFPSWVDQI